MDTKLEPKLAMWVAGTPYFHPWVDKVAQVVPNGAQSGAKGAPRLPKWSQNGPKSNLKPLFFCNFNDPGTLNIELPPAREHDFQKTT